MTDYKSKRSRNIYSPNQEKPFKLSRSKVESFINCNRCFYLDRRLGINQVPTFPFNINSAVYELLKRESINYTIINNSIFPSKQEDLISDECSGVKFNIFS